MTENGVSEWSADFAQDSEWYELVQAGNIKKGDFVSFEGVPVKVSEVKACNQRGFNPNILFVGTELFTKKRRQGYVRKFTDLAVPKIKI